VPFTPRRRSDLYASKQDVLDALARGDVALVDARMDVAYAAASGHIPRATRLTGLGFLADGEHWMTPEAARQRIADAGLADAHDVILYCGGGVAATGAFIGWRLAGLDANLRVYDGSWAEWERDPDTPKEPH
jgi:thiosulfate/3-mercaptopyruvate sulfurtransferase